MEHGGALSAEQAGEAHGAGGTVVSHRRRPHRFEQVVEVTGVHWVVIASGAFLQHRDTIVSGHGEINGVDHVVTQHVEADVFHHTWSR